MQELPPERFGDDRPLTDKEKRAAKAYRPNFADLARKFALCGRKDEEIAKFLEVSHDTYQIWRDLFPEFDQFVRSGRELATANVADALYRVSVGFTVPTVKLFAHKLKDADGNEHVEITEHVVEEYHGPNVTAIQYWLNNRDPENWKNTTHQKMDGSLEVKGGGLSGLLEAMQAAKRGDVLSD